MTKIYERTSLSLAEMVYPANAFRVLRYVGENQQIDRLQQQYRGDRSGYFWQDVPLVYIKTPDENPQ